MPLRDGFIGTEIVSIFWNGIPCRLVLTVMRDAEGDYVLFEVCGQDGPLNRENVLYGGPNERTAKRYQLTAFESAQELVYNVEADMDQQEEFVFTLRLWHDNSYLQDKSDDTLYCQCKNNTHFVKFLAQMRHHSESGAIVDKSSWVMKNEVYDRCVAKAQEDHWSRFRVACMHTGQEHDPRGFLAEPTRGNDLGLNGWPDSRQKVRIPTQRVLTVLWVHHWQRSLTTQWQNIPANMREQLALNKPQRIPLWDSNSLLRSEFGEPDKGDAPQKQNQYLWWKPLAWLGIIRLAIR